MSNIPFHFVAIHCEPANANGGKFRDLSEIVDLAKKYKIKLTMEFSAQWAEMIASDSEKAGQVGEWKSRYRHEIAAHHHGIHHSKWDGYTNVESWPRPKASMDEFLSKLLRIGNISTMCVGGDGDSQTDWLSGVPYSTQGGQDLMDAVRPPKKCRYNGCTVYELSHSSLRNETDLGRLKNLYSSSNFNVGDVFGIQLHVADYSRNSSVLKNWLKFVRDQDPSGSNNKTVKGIFQSIAMPTEFSDCD